MADRKPRVFVEAHALASYVTEHTAAPLSAVAAAHNITEQTVRRHLDPLAEQGVFDVHAGSRRRERIYAIPGTKLPDPPPDPHTAAVLHRVTARGLEVRQQRKQLRRDLRAGRRKITTVLLDPPDYTLRMPLAALLALAPGLGPVRVERILESCRIRHGMLTGATTERQRRVLARLLS
jgi:DeoR-like helix-turn-helix domain